MDIPIFSSIQESRPVVASFLLGFPYTVSMDSLSLASSLASFVQILLPHLSPLLRFSHPPYRQVPSYQYSLQDLLVT